MLLVEIFQALGRLLTAYLPANAGALPDNTEVDLLALAADDDLDVGAERTYYGVAWDAGTEINTEDFADLVPPCQALNGVSSDDEGTGASNPALEETGMMKSLDFL